MNGTHRYHAFGVLLAFVAIIDASQLRDKDDEEMLLLFDTLCNVDAFRRIYYDYWFHEAIQVSDLNMWPKFIKTSECKMIILRLSITCIRDPPLLYR